MIVSEARREANRRNSQLSTGPKTEEGKAASRRNALKHGLTGRGIAVPDEDAAEVEGRMEAFEADLKPANDVARFLARRAAMLTVRLERCVRQEAAAIARNMAGAEQAEAEARMAEQEEQVRRLPTEPATAVRRLGRSPEGIDWMIARWEELKDDLTRPGAGPWTEAHRERAENLTGRALGDFGFSRISALCRSLQGESPEPARAELARLIDDEVARLQLDREALDLDAIDRSRADAPARALFDPSKEATLARRYEAAADREFYQCLREVEEINARTEPATAPAPTSRTAKTSGEMASYRKPTDVSPPAPVPGPSGPPEVAFGPPRELPKPHNLPGRASDVRITPYHPVARA